jgi:multicomponent Na+:H+ antiporter subunit E
VGRNGAVLHAISLSAVLFCTWLLLSGYFTPLLISFGVLSLIVTVGIAWRMDVIDHESHPVHLTWRIPAYWIWLLIEIMKANFDVSKTILGIGEPARPNVIRVKPSQRSELGQVIYANSITLTPGTISIELENGEIMVHALTQGSTDDLNTGVMDRRVTQVEGGH